MSPVHGTDTKVDSLQRIRRPRGRRLTAHGLSTLPGGLRRGVGEGGVRTRLDGGGCIHVDREWRALGEGVHIHRLRAHPPPVRAKHQAGQQRVTYKAAHQIGTNGRPLAVGAGHQHHGWRRHAAPAQLDAERPRR